MARLIVVLALLAPILVPTVAEARHIPGCNSRSCDNRVLKRGHGRTLHRWKRVVAPHDSHLNSIAWCESRGNWHISTGNGYYGGLQFALRSWFAVGGRGYPHLATILEQKFRAVLLSRIQGWGAWPVCG